MELRLRGRLVELFRPTMSEVDRKAAKQALDEWHPDSRTGKALDRKPRFHSALDAGYAAGASVTLAHGVGGADGRPLSIAGGRS
jgi:hypothetical protein